MIKEDVRVAQKTNWQIVILVFVVIGLFASSIYNDQEKEKYRKSFKGEAIALATRIEHSGEDTSLRYYFYLDKKIITETDLRDYNGSRSELVNKFYKVKYNLNNPEEKYIVLEEELEPDSITLVKAGFTKTKYYIYDAGVTCKYMEKSKWK
jgi:hypothetical protein